MLSMMKQVLEGKSCLENKSGNFDAYRFLLCKAVTHFPLNAIAPMTQVRAQNPLPS